MQAAPAPGFADPVAEAQAVFRAVLDALARPGLPQVLGVDLAPPAPLTPELAALALALADADAPLWLDPSLAAAPAVAAYLRFHTGARVVADPAEAAFALVADPRRMPPFAAFAQGSEAYPDRSTTLVVAVGRWDAAAPLVLAGPGVRGEVRLTAAPLPEGLVAGLAANRALFPRGLDLILVGLGRVVGLPRSTGVLAEAA